MATSAVFGEVTVTTHQGKAYSGVVDSRTDADALWLRQDAETMSLSSAVAWTSITDAKVDGESIAADELRERLAEEASDRPALSVLLGPVETPAVVTRTLPSPEHWTNRSGLVASKPNIAAIHVAAYVGQWDADAQTDGIEVLVTAVDAHGSPAVVRGELTVRLLGERQLSRHRFGYGELERWTQPVRPEDFDPHTGSVRYRLTHRRVQPESDWRIGTEAVVHATLGVFGEGRFAASAPVVLRPYEPVRDWLQHDTGRRHFAVERAVGSPRPIQPYGSVLSPDRSPSP
ncbi:MAG: hypothetical protein AAGF31_00650 [Planctomycetota bacterium]